MTRSWTVACACAALAGAAWAAESSAAMAAGDVLIVSYIEKPPYYSTGPNSVPGGFLLERTQRVLDEAGVKARFISLPAKRVLADVEAGGQETCAIGWFKTPARERFARFSVPIYRDLPFLLVKPVGVSVRGSSLFDLLADEKLKIGVVAGYSYGERIDAALRLAGSRVEALGDPAHAYRFMAAGRADVGLFNREEYNYFAEAYPDLASSLMRVDLSDVPAGESRHLMCSLAVDMQTIERINAAINRLDALPAKAGAPRR